MTLTFEAHSDGKVIVPDQPRELPANVPLRVTVEPIQPSPPRQQTTDTDAQRRFQPLDIQLSPELSHAIAMDPEFDLCNVNVEEFLGDVEAARASKGRLICDAPVDALKWPLLRAVENSTVLKATGNTNLH